MATDDGTPVTPEGQSKRPALNHRASDHSETNNANTTSAGPSSRAKHPKHRRVGMHGRVPSSNKGLHKQHANASKVNLARRQASPADHEPAVALAQRPAPHRRATSEVKLSRNSSSGNVAKLPAQTSLKRNRSHVEVGKRTKSSEKLKQSASGTGISQLSKPSKSQVHFDLGSDDQEEEEEDEWVDASGSNSPYLSRKGSINSSAPSSAKPGGSAASSRPQTPQEADPRPDPKSAHHPADIATSAESPERKLVQHKEYLTSRLLQRSTSGAQAVPPKMSADMAEAAAPAHASPASTEHETAPPAARSHEDGLTSRFVEGPGSGVTNEGSFFNSARGGAPPPLRADELPRRSHSVTHFSRPHEYQEASSAPEKDNSALVPRTTAKWPSAPAEASRTQQKLNLQRASSTIEPGQAVGGGGVVVGVVGANPLIGVGDAGYDGANSRDPRVGKLLERHGMEYLVVRRYQNPVARSLSRLGRLSSLEKTQRIPRSSGPGAAGSTVASRRSVELPARHLHHIRNVSIPEEPVAAAQLRRTASTRTNGGGGGGISSFEADESARISERLSGSSLVGGEEDDGIAALLRNMWDRPMDLCAITD
ncbi:hypothetical protein ESCO_005570 [Escovopsis weberi]|uniref:Uncharacterized protein n=1 Tax=Escovopsis weberi TaxID=150374 RepID=A0A0M8MWI3_ESCWE|nr:hypothetical protein ESCO_005570 [Escovopsis weberi]